MNWEPFGYSLMGILGLALIARWLRLNESRISSEGKAREMAEEMLAGFSASRALLGTDGQAALVAGAFGSMSGGRGGTIALLKRQGGKVAARRLLSPLRLTQAIEGVRVDSGDRMFGAVMLFGVTDTEVRALEAFAATAERVVVTLH